VPLREQHVCPLCTRSHIKDYMTFHHLRPSIKDEEKGEEIVYICRTCHEVMHFCHSNEELRFQYNNICKLSDSKKIKDMIKLYKEKADNCIFSIKKLKGLKNV